MSSKKLTVLFVAPEFYGHINACHGIAETLRDRGHRVVFAIDISFKGKLKRYGFEEELHSVPADGPVFDSVEYFNENKDIFRLSPIEIVKRLSIHGYTHMYDSMRAKEQQLKAIIDRVEPDLIVVDSFIGCPTLTNTGLPWVWLFPAAPLAALNSDKLPAPWTGLPTKGCLAENKRMREELEKLFEDLYNKVNNWYKSVGLPGLPPEARFVPQPRSQHLNLYMYPKELDYKEVQPLPQNWRRADGFVRTTNESFKIPETLSKRPGQLVFLSMGSIGCAHLELMQRLTGILSKSEHRFIVNKGPLHDKYDLPDNMWGQEFLPQTAVLPLVDLVITHGGNNTVTETFFFGKPMLVMPLFGDQFDNAQRVQETGLGSRLSPFHCTEEELLTTVDKMVKDLDLKQTMKTIGERIRRSDDKEVIADLIENIIKENNI